MLCFQNAKGSKYHCSHDNIMLSAEKIREVAKMTPCFAKYLADQDTRDVVIDWVPTDESLGFSPPPENRKDFLETNVYAKKTETQFDHSTGPSELLDAYVSWLRSESNPRKKATIAHDGMNLLAELGTTDGLLEIRTTDPATDNTVYFYVPFIANQASLKVICDALETEHDTSTVKPDEKGYYHCDDLFEEWKCRCGMNPVEHGSYINYRWPHTVTPCQVDVVVAHAREEFKKNHVIMRDKCMKSYGGIADLLTVRTT